jgi:uncharacterized membrane protein
MLAGPQNTWSAELTGQPHRASNSLRATAHPARRNIESILQLEKQDEAELLPHHRLFHGIGWLVGTLYFVTFQIVMVGGWIALNTASATRGWAFDKYPFPLLSIVLTLEAVLLTSCVLMRQNAIDQISERRNHLDLQINLLAEEEATRSLDLLQRIAERLGVPFEKDRKSIELANETPVDEIARDLREREKQEEEAKS